VDSELANIVIEEEKRDERARKEEAKRQREAGRAEARRLKDEERQRKGIYFSEPLIRTYLTVLQSKRSFKRKLQKMRKGELSQNKLLLLKLPEKKRLV
jgi:hypothetical protein